MLATLLLPPAPTAVDTPFVRCPGLPSSPFCATPTRRGPGFRKLRTERLHCTTHRDLDVRARGQTRKIGTAIRAPGVTADRVLTNHRRRCCDTVRLLDLGRVKELLALNSYLPNPARTERHPAELRQFLLLLPPLSAEVVVLRDQATTIPPGIGTSEQERVTRADQPYSPSFPVPPRPRAQSPHDKTPLESRLPPPDQRDRKHA